MKGIIMAGGEGTRLRPLTCDCPKPMIRLMDRSVMRWTIELMKRHGIGEIAATLGYQPDCVTDRFGDGAALGVSLRYFIERTPLGTAGGVKQAEGFLDETFAVLSGDAVTDLDLTAAADFHRRSGALATLVLTRSDDPLDYGVVDLDASGRVTGFHEKPDWTDVTSDTVNTGIYILEPEVLAHIPGDRPCDFGRELFPRLVAAGLPVYGYVTRDYWCDVGDVRAYLSAHMDALEGRIRLDGMMPLPGRAVQMPGALVDRAAVLEGPCLVLPGARVCAGAYVGPGSVIGPDCVVGEQASVKRSVLWPGARLQPHAQARGCVLAAGAVLGEGAQAYEECVLGTRAQAGPRSVLMPGVKLWPGKRAAEGERLDANRVWGGQRDAGFLAGSLNAATPSEALRAARACAAGMKPREVSLGRGPDPANDALWHAAAAGLMAQGARVLDPGPCTLPMLRHAQRMSCADAALYVDGGSLTPLNALGARLPSREQRAIATLNARQDFPSPAASACPPLINGSARAAYAASLAARFAADPKSAPPVAVTCAEPFLLELARLVLTRAGLSVRAEAENRLPAPGEILLTLDPAGETCGFSDEYGALTDAQQQLMAAWAALERGATGLVLPASATRGIGELAEGYGVVPEYVAGEPAKWMNAMASRYPIQFDLWFDGLALAVTALSLLTEGQLSLDQWRRSMPSVYRRSRAVPVPAKLNGRVLQAFARSQPGAQLGGGVRFEREGGWAWVGAEEARPRLRIVTEGRSAEFARELCDFCEAELKRLAGESEGKDE